jgi:exosortase/archaeosortase family protein
MLMMKRASPIKTQICAAADIFNRYKEAPIHRTKMPSNKTLEAKNQSPRNIILYIVGAAIIILALYYLPNYFFLEKATAEHAAVVLKSLGMNVRTKVVGESVFIENIKIVKDCTGVQVIAVFSGLIIPVPKASWKNKILTLAIISTALYAANLLRIGLEFGLVYLKILPWSLAHYPLSLLLGIIGVFVLVFVANRYMPEFGDFLFGITRGRIAYSSK